MKISDLIIVVLFVCYLLGFTCLPSKAQTIPTSSIIDVKEDDRVATIYWNSKTQLYDYKYDPDKVNKGIHSYMIEWGKVSTGFTDREITPYRVFMIHEKT